MTVKCSGKNYFIPLSTKWTLLRRFITRNLLTRQVFVNNKDNEFYKSVRAKYLIVDRLFQVDREADMA